MSNMKLANGYTFPIEDGTNISNIIHMAVNEEAAMDVCAELTTENLKHVEFRNDKDAITGSYDYLANIENPTRQTQDDGTTVKVCIFLREKDALEIRLDEIEERQRQIIETQETQDGAIEDIGIVLSDLVEG